MNKRQFVTICFRMFAVFLAVGALTNIPYVYANTYSSLSYLGGPNAFGLLMSIIMVGLSFFLPWLFWKKSDYLMLKVFGDKDFFVDADGVSQADSGGEDAIKFAFSADEVLQIGLIFLGCWIVVETLLPSLIFIISLVQSDSRELYLSSGSTQIIQGAANTIGKLVIGYFLIRSPKSIISRIHTLRSKDS
ncbi:MAG TPA: hypothetical protein VIX80_09420 [Candidatus Kapabacteria bacterium]